MLLYVFVLVIEAEKVEVCIQKQNYIIYMVEKLSEILKHEWWYCQHSIIICEIWQEIHNYQIK